MSIRFYFTCQGKTVELPQNPSEITVSRQGNNHFTEVVALGEIAVLRGAKLSKISLVCPLPSDDYFPFVTGGWQRPEAYVKFFRTALENKRSVRLAVSELGISMRLLVESMEETHSATDPGGILLRLSFQQYKSYAASVVAVQTPTATTTQTTREDDKPQNKTHTIKAGDTLWAIAQRELGSGSRYTEIAALNGISNPNLIYAGNTLVLPDR